MLWRHRASFRVHMPAILVSTQYLRSLMLSAAEQTARLVDLRESVLAQRISCEAGTILSVRFRGACLDRHSADVQRHQRMRCHEKVEQARRLRQARRRVREPGQEPAHAPHGAVSRLRHDVLVQLQILLHSWLQSYDSCRLDRVHVGTSRG